MNEQPPAQLNVMAIVAHVKDRTGVDRSRGTIYNWIKSGVKVPGGEHVKLQSKTVMGQMFSTEEWVDTFLAATGVGA